MMHSDHCNWDLAGHSPPQFANCADPVSTLRMRSSNCSTNTPAWLCSSAIPRACHGSIRERTGNHFGGTDVVSRTLVGCSRCCCCCSVTWLQLSPVHGSAAHSSLVESGCYCLCSQRFHTASLLLQATRLQSAESRQSRSERRKASEAKRPSASDNCVNRVDL
jgi:hypothetical protein